jgi:hypothetical protein
LADPSEEGEIVVGGVCDMNMVRGFGPMLITAEDLARTLEANVLMLVGDGAGFKVLERP